MNTSCLASRRYPIITMCVLISLQAAWINFKISTYLSPTFSLHLNLMYSSAWIGVSFNRLEGATFHGSEIFFEPIFPLVPSDMRWRIFCGVESGERKADTCNFHLVRKISLCRTIIPVLHVAYFIYFVFRRIFWVFGIYNFVTYE
jgi:hypothetical protein